MKTYVGEAILMSTHNICFYGELTKIIFQLSSNTLLICSGIFMLSALAWHDAGVRPSVWLSIPFARVNTGIFVHSSQTVRDIWCSDSEGILMTLTLVIAGRTPPSTDFLCLWA